MHFEGIAGAINVSIVAFSIVFGVLLVLTGVIYGMKLFAGGGEKKNDVVPPTAKPSAPKPAPVLAKSVSTPAPSGDKAKIVAAITAVQDRIRTARRSGTSCAGLLDEQMEDSGNAQPERKQAEPQVALITTKGAISCIST